MGYRMVRRELYMLDAGRWQQATVGSSFLNDCVGINLLYVIEIFQGIEQLLHLDGIIALEHGFS